LITLVKEHSTAEGSLYSNYKLFEEDNGRKTDDLEFSFPQLRDLLTGIPLGTALP